MLQHFVVTQPLNFGIIDLITTLSSSFTEQGLGLAVLEAFCPDKIYSLTSDTSDMLKARE